MKRGNIDFIAAAMRNRNIVLIITAVLMIIGVVALVKMPRNEYPQFTIRQGVIVGVYPGATSEEVEEQLTRVVENYIFGLPGGQQGINLFALKRRRDVHFCGTERDVKNADQFWSKLQAWTERAQNDPSHRCAGPDRQLRFRRHLSPADHLIVGYPQLQRAGRATEKAGSGSAGKSRIPRKSNTTDCRRRRSM